MGFNSGFKGLNMRQIAVHAGVCGMLFVRPAG